MGELKNVLIIQNEDGSVRSQFVISERLAHNIQEFLRDCEQDKDVMEVIRIVQ